jgi:hypothetical protein
MIAVQYATLDLPVSKIYAAREAPNSRAAWLSGDLLQVTTADSNKTIRGKWNTGTSAIEVRFYRKAKNKSLWIRENWRESKTWRAGKNFATRKCCN